MRQKTLVFLQARMGSTRLPGKVLKKIVNKPILELIIERLSNIVNIEKIILVTSENENNSDLISFAKKINLEYFQGNEENLLDRFFGASKLFPSENIIRINADCPLIDFNLINKGLQTFLENDYDILSTDRIRTYPHGFDFEIFKTKSLHDSWSEIKKNYTNEKFSQTFISPVKNLLENPKFKNFDFVSESNLSHIRLTLDYAEDFNLIEKIYQNLYDKNPKFAMNEILEFLDVNPTLLKINKKHIQFKKKTKEDQQ